MNDLQAGLSIAASALDAQSGRLRIIAENLANADSTALGPDGNPYRRQVPVFRNVLDRQAGHNKVMLDRPVADPSDFRLEYKPGHPAADTSGYVRMPNVDPLVEMMDLRAARQSYEANLGTIDLIRSMANATLEILA